MKRTLVAMLLIGASPLLFAKPVSYTVDASHTYARYEINHMGFSEQSGTFTQVNGQVTLDKASHKGSVDVTINANSLETFFPARDKHLKSAAFFNTEKFPTMTYKAQRLVFDGDTLKQVEGQLTLLGVSKPVTLTVTHFHVGKNPMSGKETVGANAVAHIKRSDFGMTTFLPAISDEVTLDLTLEAASNS